MIRASFHDARSRAGVSSKDGGGRKVALVWLLAVLVASTSLASFEGCEETLAVRHGPEGAVCFYEVARRDGRWDEASRRLERLVATNPENPWLAYAIGLVDRRRRPERAGEMLETAVAAFRAREDAAGEILSLVQLRNLLYERGRPHDASPHVERARRVAEASGDDELRARARILEARHLNSIGADLLYAYRLLKEAQDLSGHDAPYDVRREVLVFLGNVCFNLSRFGEARRYYRDVERLAAAAGDDTYLALAKLNMANMALRQMAELPEPGGRERLTRMAEEALRVASASGDHNAEALTHHLLGVLLRPTDRERARGHLETCVELARRIHHRETLTHCLWSLGGFVADRDSSSAKRLIDEALTYAAESDNPWATAYAWGRRMRLSWSVEPRHEAIDDALTALDALETLRELQGEDAGGMSVFSAWTRDYYWLSGRILEDARGHPGTEDLDLVFHLGERLRSRALLDALKRSGASAPPGAVLEDRRRSLLRRISAVHRRLLDPRLSESGSTESMLELDRLESEFDALREEIARESPRRPLSDPPRRRSPPRSRRGDAVVPGLAMGGRLR
jgi:tetratricopeptide (TPR) repeat protein